MSAEYERDGADPPARRVALMGGAYGNVPALEACLDRADALGCDARVFLGDATGAFGHSDEVLARIAARCDAVIAGNHEQQAAAGAEQCGCGYDDPEDERLGCLAHRRAMASLSEANRRWLAGWPDGGLLATAAGPVLLCHGSPDRTNEFLWASAVDPERVRDWLDARGAVALACTHTGLPWTRRLPDGRVAVNCGAVGCPDHDGDRSVHFAMLEAAMSGALEARIVSVAYDAAAWHRQLEAEGVDPAFREPVITGWWRVGLGSMPRAERARREAGGR